MRVLSIQSHVVQGYVGNKSAVFPLQLLGFDVDMINSVQFSNHTGYGNGWTGTVLQGDELLSLTDGLAKNNLISHSHLLTGYIGSPSFLKAVTQVVAQLKAENSELKYVCDPVLGDNGKLYVPEGLVKLYQTDIIPLSYMVTPNSFECELLTGVEVTCMESAQRACDALHAMGPTVVVITSMALVGIDDKLTILASVKGGEKWAVDCKKLAGTYTGTGDLVAALLLAWDTLTEDDVEGRFGRILSKVASTMGKVIERTHEFCAGDTSNIEKRELRLIQSKRDIESGGGDETDAIVAYQIIL